jgi:hypothetical protein
MDKRIGILIIAACLSGQAQAVPFEAIGSFFSKLFKGGATKEAATAGRASENTSTLGLGHFAEQVRAKDAASKIGPLSQSAEPIPNMTLDPVGKNRNEIDTYKVLRTKAEKGDTDAMMIMSDMTTTGRVSDPGEPFHAYWLINATRVGSQAASKKLQGECASKESMRNTDQWFDLACYNIDHRTLYIGDKLPGAYTTLRTTPAYQLK